MKVYQGSDKVEKKDYQPSEKQFAGAMMGKTNEYMARTDATMNKAASKVKSQAYKGRYS